MRRWKLSPWTTLAVLIAVVVFFKNAWVCEDAYINFRSIEQLFAGRGPVWNPHERVQVFTSPLWFGLLAVVRLVSPHAFLNAIGLSLGLWLATLVAARRHVGSPRSFLLLVLAMHTANGFADFTSSGLENSLLYFLIAVFILLYFQLLKVADELASQALKKLWLVAGLILLTRSDQLFLIAPALIAVTWRCRHSLSRRRVLALMTLGLGPLALWITFSFVYYGYPFPNTAYAKLSTGIERFVLLRQGLKYFLASLGLDTITLLLTGAFAWFGLRHQAARWLAVGVVLQLGYVATVGGDFMQGRFLATSFLVAILVAVPIAKWRLISRPALWAGLILYAAFYPHTPLNSAIRYPVPVPENHLGVADERGIYNDALSLWQFEQCRREGRAFPDMEWRTDGEGFAAGRDSVTLVSNIGVFGYAAGTEKIVIDRLALSDPFLARLPCQPNWRVGHYQREVPAQYIAALAEPQKTGELNEAHLQTLHNDIVLITRSPDLFSAARWRAIIRQNFRVNQRP